MADGPAVYHSETVEHVVDVARRRLGDATATRYAAYFRRYYARVASEDVQGETAEALFAAAFAHARLAERRRPGRARIRVYNPDLDEDGWRCRHTVIEVVTDDMPFLVDSLTAEFNSRDLAVFRVIHPVFAVSRADDGTLIAITAADQPHAGSHAESFIHVQIARQPEADLAAIGDRVEVMLADVRAAVGDFEAMRRRMHEVGASLAGLPAAADEEAAEAAAFLDWLATDNFTFLGYRAFRFEPAAGGTVVRVEPGSGLGLLRDPHGLELEDLRDGEPPPPPVQAFVAGPEPLQVGKANRVATVHRRVHIDVIAVKAYQPEGAVAGQHLFAGLFASPVYNRSVRSIPWLRRKVERLVARVGFDARGHDGRALLNVLETYPRDELFQVGDDALTGTALGILHLQHRPRVAVFVRRDAFDRFVGCLIYLPRDRYTTDLRLRIQGILERAFAGRVTAHFAQVGDLPLARLQIYLQTTPGQIPAGALAGLQEAIVTACRTWADGLLQALTAVYGDERGRRLYRRYALAFPPGYRDRFSEEQAVGDIACCEETLTRADVSMTLYRPIGAENDEVRFKIFHPDAPIVLSQVLPLLEHLGLQVIDEDPHAVRVAGEGARTVMIHDFGLRMTSGRAIELASVRDHFQETFRRVWQGAVESDGFNALVLAAGLTWRQVVILRACCKMLRQAGIAFSQAYMERTLAAHPGISRLLVDLFETMFDPEAGNGRAAAADAIRAALAKALDGVASADEDRILRRFLNLVESTLRTNYFQTGPDGTPKPYLALKLDSRRLDDLPAPRPMVEVFVYSPEVEGVHLRGGKVARGGIRWSDRREDFRTEILGLMKAQTVKNAVIVPVGAKGGFVVKRRTDPLDREAALAAGIACYRTFIRGLLDLTDTLAGGRISVPAGVVRRDDDDPYLVVAADKGTATFSDIANAIAAEYGFWLGDAFASGGSQGYDHKKIAITARGAWESVKRHFRELGIDVQASDFTVVGVGDMSGDVFGNAMLLSPHIRLVAAFDHRHIFVDPEPDAARSLDERARLFLLQRSSWADYDEAVLSPGGRVFERGAKMVPLSPEIRARFNLAAERMTPSDLIRRLITAEVDLLWFGGIGTFVKAADETDAEVGDRSNDAVRVNGRDLRCRVIGEGANLGLTQLGRIEFALRGGRLNSDFIDNSAGVDCSDHEVNIKILLDAAVADGDLTLKQRNKLLTAMTDEVAALVLRDNYQQTQAISQIEAEGFAVLDSQARLIRLLERQGRLDRAVEFLPDEDALAERSAAKQGLSRPEIAVLFSYCKIWLHAEVLASDLPDDRHLAADVERYFPSAIRRRLPARIAGHPLRRELAATVLTNSLINRVGGTFVSDIIERTGLPPAEIARAYIIARDVFRARDLWQAIEAEDSVMPAAAQVTLRRDVRRLIERATLWFLANGGRPLDIAAAVAEFAGVVAGLADDVEALLPAAVSDRIQFRTGRYRRQGVPEGLARRIAFLIVLPSVLDIVRLAAARGEAPDAVARLYFQLGETLGFGWLRYQAEKLAVDSHWQKLAAAAVIDELYAHQRNIARRVLEFPAAAAGDAIAAWSGAHAAAVERTRALIAELNAVAAVDLSMLTVASRQLRTLAED